MSPPRHVSTTSRVWLNISKLYIDLVNSSKRHIFVILPNLLLVYRLFVDSFKYIRPDLPIQLCSLPLSPM